MPDTNPLRRRSVGAPAARSVLLTILGEYVLPRRGPVWQQTLVWALEETGYSAQAARQALARSMRDGWLVAERDGRRARMSLSPATASMLAAGTERIYGFGIDRPWDGEWLVVVMRVPEKRREVRQLVRARLAWAGLGSLGGGVGITPRTEREPEVADIVAGYSAAEVVSFRGRLGVLGQSQALARTAWDLDHVRDAYANFLREFSGRGPNGQEQSFARQTALVHSWRKFPFLDPDLPAELLPRNWPRSRARALFQDCHAKWERAAREHFETLESTVDP